jgi:hypothetical protein
MITGSNPGDSDTFLKKAGDLEPRCSSSMEDIVTI